jgi:hypothetical protein
MEGRVTKPVDERRTVAGLSQAPHVDGFGSYPVEEYRPTAEALDLFERALSRSARRLALAVGTAMEQVLAYRGPDPVLVSPNV